MHFESDENTMVTIANYRYCKISKEIILIHDVAQFCIYFLQRFRQSLVFNMTLQATS